MALQRRRDSNPGADGSEAHNDPGIASSSSSSSCCCCCWCSCSRDLEIREAWREVDLHGLRRMIPKSGSGGRRTRSAVRRSVWAVLLVLSLVAFVYLSTECLFIYLAQAPFTLGLAPETRSHYRSPPAVTLCNLNPLRLTELARKAWPTEARDVTSSGHIDTSAWNDVNVSSFDVFTSAGHRLEKLVIKCSAGENYPCSRTNFTEVITEKGLCYTLSTSASALFLVLNAEAYEYTGLGQEGVGIRVLFHGAEEHPVPTSAFSGLMLAPGLRASVRVHEKDVTFIPIAGSPCTESHQNDSPRCLESCVDRELEQRCSCRPFWSLTKVDNRHAWCSIKQHTSCVMTKISELLAHQPNRCSCLRMCHSQEFHWDYTFSHLVPGPTSTDRGRRFHGDVIPETRLAEIASDRCVAANVAARTSRTISRRDAEQITELDVSVTEIAERVILLQENFQRVESALNVSLADLRYRIGFHTRVGLGGLRKSFTSGLAERFELVRERSLVPLIDGNYETESQVERTVKQLTFTSTTETIARKVIYFMTDNLLSGKLETAIQALDNITKVYYSFLNTDPVSTTEQITPGGRYDLHLLPFALLSKTQNAMKTYYTGISENVAGLIENILSLKAVLKDVYQSNSVNETLFELSRKHFIQRTLHIKHFTTLFQQQIVQDCIDRIDTRINELVTINDTLNRESLLVTLGIDTQSTIISTLYTEAYNNVLAFSRLAQQFLRDNDVLKSSLTNSNTDVFIQSPALTFLTDALGSLRRSSTDLRQHWVAVEKGFKSSWKRFIREDLLSNFYLNLYNDVTDMVNNPKRAEQFQELFFQSSTFNLASLHPVTSMRPSDYVPNDFYTLLNADVSVTNVEAKMAAISEEFHGYMEQTDPQVVIGSARIERLVKAFNELKSNLEELQRQCSISPELIRENLIVVEITLPSSSPDSSTSTNVYSLTSLLANIGGLLALFLGASLMTFFELADVIVQSLCRSIGNRKSNKFADTSNHVLFRPVNILDDGAGGLGVPGIPGATATLRPPAHVVKVPLPASIPKLRLDSGSYRGKQGQQLQHQAETDI